MARHRIRRVVGALVVVSTIAMGLATGPAGAASGTAAILPDEDVLVRTESGLVRIAADGTRTQVVSGLGAMSGSVDPTGTSAVFWGFEGTQDLWRVNLDATGLTRLTNDATAESWPSFSPDGSKILFNRYLEAGGQDEIFTMDLDGSNVQRLTTSSGFDMEARYSPDGTKIAFRSQRSGNSGDIWVMNADGSNPVQLTSDTAADVYPDWSPDGTRIAFTSARSGSSQIYVMGADGSNVVALTSSGFNTHPSWSVDGSAIAYSSDGDLRAVTPDGRTSWQMTATPSITEWYPDWIPGTGGDEPVTRTVTVTTSGSGTGKVTSAPAGIACPPTCSASFADGQPVSLGAAPDPGSSFTGFTGACSGPTCSLTATSDLQVDAAFASAPTPQPPDAIDDGYTVAAGSTLTVVAPGVLGNDTDPEGEPLAASVVDEPTHGSVTIETDGSFTYTPDVGYTGADSFRYAATDTQALTDDAIVSLTVTTPPPADPIVWAVVPNGGLWVGGGGRAPAQVVTGDAWTPSWSPDKSQITFASERDGMSDIWVVNADGTGLAKVTNDEAHDGAPAWSPDGSRIALASDRDGDFEIWTVDIGGGSKQQLTFDSTYDNDPAWSPTGDRIAYRSDAGIEIVSVDGTTETTLVAGVAIEETPDWSPDGLQIAFTALTSGQPAEIHVIDVDGTDERAVSFAGSAADPSWSPAGTHLAFMGYNGGAPDVWVADADGANAVNITDSGAAIDVAPDWGQPPAPPPPPSDFETTATPDADGVAAGGNLIVEGRATNGGTVTANGTVLELESVGGTLASVVGKNCAITSPTTASCPFGAFAAGKSLGYRATLHAGPPGSLALTTRLRCECGVPPDVGTVRRPIVPSIAAGSVGVVVTGPDAAAQGDSLQYRFTVTNRSAVPATSTRLTLQATLAAGVALPITGSSTAAGPCGQPTVCDLGELAPGASAIVTMSVADPGGRSPTIAGGVTCTCTDSVATDNTVVMRTHVTPRLDLTLSIANPTTVKPGAPIPWTGTIEGLGTGTVSDVVVDFIVPAGVVVSKVTAGVTGGIPYATCTVIGQRVRCRFPTAQGRPQITIIGTPTGGGTYQLVGTILGGGYIDSNPANNTVTGTPVTCPGISDLVISKQSTQTRASVGDTVSWNITVENRGPDAATGAKVIDYLPVGFAFVGVTGAPNPCTVAGGRTVTCPLGSFPAGSPLTITVRARATAQVPSAVNSAEVQCTCWEPPTSPSNKAVADGVRVWPAVRPVTVTTCAPFRPLGSCTLDVTVHNDNGFTIPGGTIDIGPLDPVNGPRLDTAIPLPTWYRCTDLGTVIRCTLGGIPAGGQRLIVPLLPITSGSVTLQLRWDCGCTDRGALVTSTAPIAPIQTCIGGQVLFDSDATRDRDIYAARLDGSGSTNLTDNVGVEETGAVWSPDSSRFVFSRGKPGARQLWIAALDGFGCITSQRLVPNQPSGDNYQPEWAPRDNRLAFISSTTGNHDIWVIRTDGSGRTRITTSPQDDRAPSFSKDGSRIAFASERNAQGAKAAWNIFTAKADGTGGELFLSGNAPGYDGGKAADYSPSFSRGPGPSQVLWHSNATGDWDLWVMNADGSGKQRLPGATSLAEKNADWSADGTKIVYDAGTGTAGIWIMNADGSGRRVVDQTGGIDQAPSLHTATLPPRPCGSSTTGGGAGVTTTVYELGASNGTFGLSFDAFSIPDQFEVLYEGNVIYSTNGAVSGRDDVQITFSGNDTHVAVRVSGPPGTEWNYTLRCPT